MADIELMIEIPEEEYRIAKYGQYGNINIDIIRNAIKNGTPLPKGHWVDNPTIHDLCNCSECGALSKVYSNYCPNCGAKMIEPQESEG